MILCFLTLLRFTGNAQVLIVGLSGDFEFNTKSEDPEAAIEGISGFFSFNTLEYFDDRLEGISHLFEFNTLPEEPELLVGISGTFSFNTIDQFAYRIEGISDYFDFTSLPEEQESLVGISGTFRFYTLDEFAYRIEGVSDYFDFNTLPEEPEPLVGISGNFRFYTIDEFAYRIEGLSEFFDFNTLQPMPESLIGFSMVFSFNTMKTTSGALVGLYEFFSFNTFDSALPVEWLYFDATAMHRSIKLHWQTASEINNDFYTVLRSADGYSFEPLALIPGAGTTSTVSEYKWTDPSPLPGINYYQLKQTDFDGTTGYSPIVAADIHWLAPPKIFVFDDMLHFQLSFKEEKPIEFTLFDPLGRMVKSGRFLYVPGVTHVVNLSNIPRGMLLVHLRGENQIYSEKVLNVR